MAQYNPQGKIIERTTAIHHSSGEEITDSKGLPVTVTARSVAKLTGHNLLSITDTTAKLTSTIDVSTFKEKTIHIVNLLDQAVNIIVSVSYKGSTYWFALPAKSVNAGTYMMLNEADLPKLNSPYSQIRISAQCTVAPTTGNLSTFIEAYTL